MSNNSHKHNSLADAYARVRASHGLRNASDEVELRCPLCGGTAPEGEFDEVQEDTDDNDGDEVDHMDEVRTDDVTGVSDGNSDSSNEGDAAQVPKWDNRVALAKALARDLAAGANKGSIR